MTDAKLNLNQQIPKKPIFVNLGKDNPGIF